MPGTGNRPRTQDDVRDKDGARDDIPDPNEEEEVEHQPRDSTRVRMPDLQNHVSQDPKRLWDNEADPEEGIEQPKFGKRGVTIKDYDTEHDEQ